MKHKYTDFFRLVFAFCAIISVMTAGNITAWGQTSYNMVNNDTLHIYPCTNPTGTIYDNGGPSSQYAHNFEGWAIISVPQNVTITLTGSYATESCCDKLWVYDGRGQSGNAIVNNVGGNGTINVSSSTGWLSIRFHSDGSSTNAGFALTYSIEGTGATCSNTLSNLTISSITTNSADISWTASNPASTFIVSVNGQQQTVTSTSLSLTGLNANTYYNISVVDQTDAGSACCELRSSFRTPCGTMSAPVVEYFDDMGTGVDVLPSCWVRQKNYDDADNRYPQLTGVQYVSSPASLLMFCGSNDVAAHWSLAIGPEISDDISSLFVRFHMRATNANARIEVGICDDTSLYDNNFTPVDTISVTEANSWQQKVAAHLSRYSGTGRHIAFRMLRSLQPGNSVTVYIDNLIIEPCGVWQINRQERDIDNYFVYWTNIGNPTVDIEIGPVGFTPGTGTMHNNVTSPYHFTGLEPGTVYQLRFYSTCAGISREQTGINGTTLARDSRAVDFCEGFEDNGDNMPSGWRRLNLYNNSPRANTSSYYSGSRSLYFNPRQSGNYRPIAVMPRIDTIDINQLSVSFMLRNSNSSSYTNRAMIEVGVMEFPEYPDSFVPIDTVYSNNSWALKKVSLESYTGNGHYIAFRAYETYDYSSSIYLDNLEVGPCLVTGEELTNIGAHRIEVRWDTVGPHFHGDSVTIEYGAPGFTPGSGTIVRVPVSGSGVQTVGGKQRCVINGLQPNTDYQFVVYGDCAHVTQHCLFSRSAHTLEADIALPYCQQFDGLATGGMPSGWSRPAMYSNRPRIWNSVNRSGDRSLQLCANGNLSYSHSLAVMPMFDVDSVRGMTVSFYTYGTNNYNPRIQVGVMDNPNDESTFTVVSTRSLNNGAWSSNIVDLSSYTGTGQYIAFRYYHENCNGCTYDAYIDDIVVSNAATANRSAYSVTSHGATLKWTGPGRAYNGAIIEWGPEGFVPGTGHRDTVPASVLPDQNGYYHYTLDTLQPGTTYNLFITALSSEIDDICNYTRQSFTTAAEPLQSSYCYGFDDLANETYPWNYSWFRPQMYGAEPRATTDAHSAPYAMYLRSYYNNNNPEYRSLAAMPYLEEASLDGLTMRFYAKGGGSNSRFAIGMMSDPNLPATFEGLDTFIVNHSDWRLYSVDLSQYSGTARHIAFLHYSLPTWESGWVYFDDITINRCRVSDVRTYSHSSTSFVVDWTVNGTADSVEIEYGPQGFAPGTGTTIGNAVAPQTISGLQPGTTYDYYVRPHCTGSGSACSETKFTTSTIVVPVAAGYCEDFSGYNTFQRPQHWTTLAWYGDHPFIYNHTNPEYYISPVSALEFRSNASNSNLIVMPAAEEDVSNLIMSFHIRCSDQLAPEQPSLIVGVMTLPYDSTTFVAVDTVHPSFNYRPVNVSLASYTGTGRHIAFRYRDNGERYTYIDDLTLSHCHVADIQVSGLNDTAVTLSWNRIGYTDTTYIAYDTLGGNNHFPQLATTTSQHTITNLLPDHTYQFHLWGKCQDTTMICQASNITVTTLSTPPVVPYCEGFEGFAENTTPSGWTIPVNVPNTSVANVYHDGQRSMRLSVREGSNSITSFAVMPELQTDNISAVYFDAWLTADVNPTSFTVGIMTDPNDTTTFTAVHVFNPAAGSWNHIKCPFASYTGAGKYIAFRAAGGNNDLHYLYLDDINLRSCAVTTAQAVTPTETSINLQWSTNAQQQAVYVEYKATGSNAGDFLPGTGTMELITDNPHTFSGLQEATWYTFHVYPVCDTVFDGCNYETTSLETLHPWVDLPYCENFESINTALPNNWLNLSTNGYPIRTSMTPAHDSTTSYFANMYASASDSTLFVLPRIYIGSQCPVLDRLYANFWTLFSGSDINQALLEVGIMTDANDPATFTPQDTVTPNSDTWQHNIKTINNYNTASNYVAFRLRSLDGSPVYCFFDDLCMEKCVAADVSVSNITQNSVTITWNNYSVDTLICEYGPTGYQLGNGTVIAITESPYVLTGLADGSDYEFTFASVCGCDQYGTAYTPGGGSWGGSGGWGGGGWGWYCCVPCYYDSTQWCRWWRWGYWHGHSWSWWYSQGGGGNWVTPPVIDITTQAAMLETPYCESFEIEDTVAFPPSWRRRSGSHYPDVSTTNHHTGEKSMRFYATPGNSCYSALPPLEMGLTSSMVLTFYAYSTNSNATNANARFIVGVMNNPDIESTFTPIDTVQLTDVNKWQQFSVNFAPYTGEGQYIAFRFAPVEQAYNFYIDDLYLGPCAISGVTAIPNVSNPANVSVSWTSHNTPDRVLIQYGPQGMNPVDADSLFRSVYTTSSPVVVTIDPDSSYDFFVSAICNDTATGSCLVEPVTVNPSLLMPYCDNFEGHPTESLPEEWKILQRPMNLPNYPMITEQSDGSHALTFNINTGTGNIVALLPPLPTGDSLAGKWINVRMKSSTYGNVFLDLGYLTDTLSPASFVTMVSINNTSSGTTQEFNRQLTGNNGNNGNRLAVRARSTSGERWLYLDRIIFSDNPYPTGISTTAYGVARREIRWNNNTGNSHFTLEYGYGDNWIQIASDSCRAILTDLQPDLDYEVFFIAPDGERLCIPYTFHNESYMPLPYCDNFDSYDNLIVPPLWYSYSSYGDNYPRTYNSCYNSCCRTMDFYSNNSHNQYTALPDFDVDSIRNLDLQFSLRIEQTNYTKLQIGVMEDRTNYSTFVPVDTLTCSSNSTHYKKHINLSRYHGNGRYVAFRILTTTSSRNSIFIDDLVVSACPMPNFTVVGSTTFKAEVPRVSDVDYYIEYAPRSFAQGEQDTIWNTDSSAYTLQNVSTIVHVTENPFFLEGLNPATTYTLYSRCDSLTPTCTTPITLTTSGRVPIPYCESFDSYPNNTMPTGWKSYLTNNDCHVYKNSNGCLEFYNYHYQNYRTYAIMPDIDIDSIRNAHAYLDMYTDGYLDRTMIIVGVMENRDNINTFVPVDTLRNSSNRVWQTMHLKLSRYTGNGRFLAFCLAVTSNSSYPYVSIDNLRIQTCPRPAPSLSAGTTVRFDMDTTTSAPDYWIEYGPQGIMQMAEDTVWNNDSSAYTLQPHNSLVHVTETPFFITGLNENTTYDFYSRCDSAISTCFPTTRITTSRILPLTYCESFDSYPNNTMPTGWKSYLTNNDCHVYKNSNGCLEFYNYHYQNYRTYAIMPDIDIDSIRNAHAYLDMYTDGYLDRTMIIVGVMENRDNINTFVPVDTLRNSSNRVWQTMHLKLSRYTGNGRFLAFCLAVTSNSSYPYVSIDNLRIQTCPRPAPSLSAGTTVRFDMDTTTSAPDYWIEYGPQGIMQMAEDTVWNNDSSAYTLQPHNSLVHVTETPFFITGLNENTTYDFYSRCDSAISTCFPTTRITTMSTRNVPYCETFSGYGSGYTSFPSDWRRHVYNSDNSYLYVYNDGDAEDSRSLRFYTYSNRNAYAVLPEMDNDNISSLFINTKMWSQSGTDVGTFCLEVGVMTNPYNINTFQVVDTLRNTTSGQWQYLSASLARYNGEGRFIAIRMRENNGNWRSIYLDRIEVLSCDIPTGVTASLHSSNTVRINAADQSSTGFLVEYGPQNFTQGEGTILQVNQLPFDIELDYSTTYDFYFRCDTNTLTCRPKQTVTTHTAPSPLPLCENFESYGNNNLPTSWSMIRDNNSYGNIFVYNNNANNGSRSLHFDCYYNYSNYAILPDMAVDSLKDISISLWLKGPSGSSLVAGAMSNPNDKYSFIPVKTLSCNNDTYKRYIFNFSSLPNDARFIAFRSNTPNSCCWRYLYMDDIYIDTIGACDFRITNVESDEVTFEWSQVGHPSMSIEYGPAGFARGTGTTINVTQSPFVLTGLDPLTNYKFYFDAISQPGATGYCNTNYNDSAAIFTPAGGTGCIDPTNFTADYTTCFYGTYGNPYQTTGRVDYGSDDIRSRHTVHYDDTATDPRTGGLLQIVPEGAAASVRLGNWNSNSSSAEGEAITYSLYVDTTSFDLLVLKYAAVLQDPLHAPSDQPRFSLEVLDSNNTLLDAQCAAADFIANRNLGWNQAAGGVLWKDWTMVGVDMSPYAGQTVRIRLTTRDCGEGNHYGYAYFTLGCMMKNMRSELCGDVDSNTFYAPAGFAYRWYSSADSTDTISTAQSIKVQTDTVTYFCECSFVDNANCHFTISAYAGTRYPLAGFNYTVEVHDCQFHVTFNNTSTISPDGINPLGTGEGCESALWDFGDGQASANYNVTHIYNTPGTYHVNLVSGIADNTCTDTASQTITLTLPGTAYELSGDSNICLGNSATLTMSGAYSFTWNDGSTLGTRTFTPDTTTQYSVSLVDSNGCADTLRHIVNVFPISYNNIYETTVENNLPYTYINNVYAGDTLDTIALTNFAGCDSIVYFQLHVYRNVTASDDSTVCESALPMQWNNKVFDSAGTIIDTLATTHGADSVLTMTLYVIPTTYANYYDTTIENSLPVYFNGHTYVNDTVDTVSILNVAMCDSIIYYSLFVNHNVSSSADSAICQSELPFTWNHRTFTEAGSLLDTLTAHTGADSVLTMNLTVYPTYDIYDTFAICENSLPYIWRDTTIGTDAGNTYISDYTIHRLSVNLCDSAMHLNLTVDSNTHSSLTHSIIENNLPYTWNNRTFDTASTQLDTLVNAAGCDSLITMTLTVFENVGTAVDSTVCQSALPVAWNSRIFDSTDFNTQMAIFSSTKFDTLSTINGADSVVTMTLNIIPTTYSTVNEQTDEAQLPYSYYHHSYTGPVHNDTVHILGVEGCDSIVTYSLAVSYTVDSTVCQSALPITWNNRIFTGDSSTYNTQLAKFVLNDTLVAISGGDSLLTMQLSVIPTTYSNVYAVTDENMLPYTYHHHTYQGPVVNDTLHITGVEGCDSIVSYSLAVNYIVDSSVCITQLPLTWNSITFETTIAGITSSFTVTERDTLTSVSGGDSLLTMRLTVHPTYHWYDTSVVCRNMLPYSWRDTVFGVGSMDGDYNLSRLSIHGCDSLMSLKLTIGDTFVNYDTIVVCASNAPMTWLDTSLAITHTSASATASDLVENLTLHRLTALGCDSNYHLQLTIHPTFSLRDTAIICENSLPYSWRDTSINVTPTVNSIVDVQLSVLNSLGCDSTMLLNLTVDTNTHSVIHEYIVENQLPYSYHSYTIISDSLSTSSQQSEFDTSLVIPNSHGCDSIISYTLTVYHNVASTANRSICSDALPITWNGVTFDASDFQLSALNPQISTKTATLATYTGADSVVTMNLTVNPVHHTDDNIAICRDALPYSWQNITVSSDSLPEGSSMFSSQFTTLNIYGCDSSFSLNLTVNDTYDVVEHIESCEPYLWNDGITYTVDTYGPQITLASIAGCDSVVTLDFQISAPTYTYLADSFCLGTIYTFHGTPLTTGGIYNDTLQTTQHCDSIVSLTLTALTTPQIYIDATPDCEWLTYNIIVNTTVDYLQWSYEGHSWNTAWGPQDGAHLLVRPNTTTTLTLVVDYLPEETCPATQSIILNPIIQPMAQMQVTPEYLTYEQTTLSAVDRSSGAIAREWFVDGVSFGEEQQITYSPDIFSDSVELLLTVASEQCVDSVTQIVYIYRNTVYSPNAFTPDESTNREFLLKLDGILEFELNIYNRQGLLVFQTTDPQQPWDGTFKGKPCPQGNYVWVLKYTTNDMPQIPKTQKGSVLLIR